MVIHVNRAMRHERNLDRAAVFQLQPGWIAAGTVAGRIARCTLPRPDRSAALAALGVLGSGGLAVVPEGDELLSLVGDLLQSYFAGRPTAFDLPLALNERPHFTRHVLQACAAIPYGTTVTYGELARNCGQPAAARAVGQVMARNPIPIIIPCHRVVGSGGRLTGFGGGLGLKAELLRLEAQALDGASAAARA